MSEIPEISVAERLEAGRAEVRRAVASDVVIKIHPFDLYTLLQNPMTLDVLVINLFDKQFLVIDGAVYECFSTVPNKTKLKDIIAAGKDVA